jgi:hypothetical protein
MPRAFAATSASRSSPLGFAGFHRMATRDTVPSASLRSSSRFPARSDRTMASPVTLPPGRARLATRPAATGSPMVVMTIGVVVVARWTARTTGGPPDATMRSILRRRSSATRSGSDSYFPFADRSGSGTPRSGSCRSFRPRRGSGPARSARFLGCRDLRVPWDPPCRSRSSDVDHVEHVVHALPSFASSHFSRHGPVRPLDLGPIPNRL